MAPDPNGTPESNDAQREYGFRYTPEELDEEVTVIIREQYLTMKGLCDLIDSVMTQNREATR